jgi:hypothetical protein
MKYLFTIFFMLPLTVFGETLVVDSTGNGDYTDIQSAIDNAADGDTIFIKIGTYSAFGVIDKEVTLIGQSNSGTKISDDCISVIATKYKCEINNLRFTGPDMQGGLYIKSYSGYRETGSIPELIIENCLFDYSPPQDIEGSAITIVVIYEDMMHGNELETLSNKIRIHNNTFYNLKTAIDIYQGGVIAKLDKIITDSLKILTFDGRNNYYGVFDSLAINELIIDDRDELGLNFVYVTHFEYTPWSDTLITKKKLTTAPGISFNNFINNEIVFEGGLAWDTTYVSLNEIPKLPLSFCFLKTYPNPFNSNLMVEFRTEKQNEITFRCFDSAGREIKKLYSKNMFGTGLHTYPINFTELSSGHYLITLTSERMTHATKVLLIK